MKNRFLLALAFLLALDSSAIAQTFETWGADTGNTQGTTVTYMATKFGAENDSTMDSYR